MSKPVDDVIRKAGLCQKYSKCATAWLVKRWHATIIIPVLGLFFADFECLEKKYLTM
jgi:hypothetical protein